MKTIATLVLLVLIGSVCANDIPSPPGMKAVPPGWIDNTPKQVVKTKINHDMLTSSVVAEVKAKTSPVATYEVHCPADAIIWVNGYQQNSTGELRVYESNPAWKGDGKFVFRALIGGAYYEKEAQFKPGERQVLNFNAMRSTQQTVYPTASFSTSGSCSSGTCGR